MRKDIAYVANISQVFSGRISDNQYGTCIFNIRDITHQQTQEITISSQMTVVEKNIMSSFTYFRLEEELKGR